MADETKGANHFRTSLDIGLEIMFKLRGNTSGLAIPHFVIDAPGGGGKIPVLPQYVLHRDDEKIVMRNYKNEIYVYRETKEEIHKGNGKAIVVEPEKIQIEISNKKNGSVKKPKNFKDITEIKLPELETSPN